MKSMYLPSCVLLSLCREVKHTAESRLGFTLNRRFNTSPRMDDNTILWTYACIVKRNATCPAVMAGLTSDGDG